MSNRPRSAAPPEMSLEEALSLDPEEPAPCDPIEQPKPRASTFRTPAMFLAASQLLKPTTHLNPTSLWRRRHNQAPVPAAPPRPERPPPEKCPPDQPFFSLTRAQVFPNAPQLAPRLSVDIPSKHMPHPTVLASPRQSPKLVHQNHISVTNAIHSNIHHEIAYKRLTGCPEAIEQETSISVGPLDGVVTHEDQSQRRRTVEHRERSATTEENLDNSSFRGSFSTLPSTASKLALKPLPLRLSKGDQCDQPPPIPLRSKLRNANTAIENQMFDITKRMPAHPVAGPQFRSSCDTISIYSIDSNGYQARLPDTPPSSPPEISQCLTDHSSSSAVDPNICAENLRSELGIIDDTYDMYTDCDKHTEHEADFDVLSASLPARSELSRMRTRNVSREQARLQKERARQAAIEKLEEPRTDLKVPQMEFEQWLGHALHVEERRNLLDSLPLDAHRQDSPTKTQRECCLSACVTPTCRVVESIEEPLLTTPGSSIKSMKSVESLIPAPDPFMDQPNHDTKCSTTPDLTLVPACLRADDNTEYRPSLAILQDQLKSLMADCMESYQTQSDMVGHGDVSRSPAPSTCTSVSEYSPTNLQMIHIEWRGKKYPVLIGDQGRIWEAPCVDPYCEEHGGPRKELVFGKL